MKAVLASYTLRLATFRRELFKIRTFRGAGSGSFFTRLGIGGMPFLLPLLYQVGLGFTPIQSGLLIMPQAVAAMSMKMIMPRLLMLIGYRGVLISNTVILGVLLALFATIGLRTSVWVIVFLAFLYGAFASLQYTSMNTLVYADTRSVHVPAESFGTCFSVFLPAKQASFPRVRRRKG
jgi:hypothetical protein